MVPKGGSTEDVDAVTKLSPRECRPAFESVDLVLPSRCVAPVEKVQVVTWSKDGRSSRSVARATAVEEVEAPRGSAEVGFEGGEYDAFGDSGEDALGAMAFYGGRLSDGEAERLLRARRTPGSYLLRRDGGDVPSPYDGVALSLLRVDRGGDDVARDATESPKASPLSPLVAPARVAPALMLEFCKPAVAKCLADESMVV